MGLIEEPFGYSKQQRHPQAPLLSTSYPLPWQSFTLAGGHRSSQWPSYPSTPATCPGNGHPPAATTRLLHRLHPTEENKHTPTNKPYTAGGGGYTPLPPLCTGYTQHRHGVYTASYLAPRDCSSFLVNRPPPPFLLTIAVSFLFDRIPLPCQPRSTTTLLSFSPFVTDRGTERRIWIRFNLVLKGGERDRTMIFLLNERLKDRYRYRNRKILSSENYINFKKKLEKTTRIFRGGGGGYIEKSEFFFLLSFLGLIILVSRFEDRKILNSQNYINFRKD